MIDRCTDDIGGVYFTERAPMDITTVFIVCFIVSFIMAPAPMPKNAGLHVVNPEND